MSEHGGTGSDKYAGEERRLRRHILRAISTSAGVQGCGGEIGFEAGGAGGGGGGARTDCNWRRKRGGERVRLRPLACI